MAAERTSHSFMMVLKLSLLLFVQVNGGLFSNCGKLSSTCVRDNSVNTPEYLALSAADKETKIMANVLTNTNSGEWWNAFRTGSGILRESMCTTFR